MVLLLILAFLAYIPEGNSKYVNTFIGTDYTGHTFPGATYPFGMMQLSPDTRLSTWEGCSGYHYSDSLIYGFSHTHLSGTGCLDYGDILLMPVTDYTCDSIDNSIYRSLFRHETEKASPGYYEVFLEKPSTKVRLTSGKRAGMHEYIFPEGAVPQIVLDLKHRDLLLDSKLNISNAHGNSVEGYRISKSWAEEQSVYFYLEFSEPIEKIVALEKDKAAVFSFSPEGNNKIRVKIGISSVSCGNAKQNLESEIKEWNFDSLLNSTVTAWNNYLSKIEIESDNKDELTTFYTALYHTAISPNLYSDINGEYRGQDRKVHKAEGYAQYTVFSLWDTYRALHPLFTIIEKKRTVDFLKSFLAIYNEGGKLPIWELAGNETNCMIGFHSVPVIADAISKGITGFDEKALMKAMVSSSERDEYGIKIFNENGLVISDMEHESVSKTLEYAYDDWCISQTALILSKKYPSDNEYQHIHEKYMRRAQYYKNLFDPESGFMRPKINGCMLSPFFPTEINVHYTEGNAWQYNFYVPHDVSGHIKILGSEDAYFKKLDSLFTISNKTTGWGSVDVTGLIGQYAQGNEPSHHAAYLFPYLGQAWRTQEIVNQINTTLFNSSAGGLCGNDDCGQMSAWYVFSTLGFYPVCPGDNTYVLGSPLFTKAVINLENGKKFTISADEREKSKNHKYISSAKLDGINYKKAYITHSDIEEGKSLALKMSDSPTKFGSEHENRPKSSIQGKDIVVNPWFEVDNTSFNKPVEVKINALREDYKIMYSIDNGEFKPYLAPVTVSESCILKAYCKNDEDEKSFITSVKLNAYNPKYSVKILSKYNPQYNAGGDNGLIDGVRGTNNFRTGGWQGYQNTDFEAIIDLKEETAFSEISAGFLQDTRSWIIMPLYVEFFVSDDGINFRSVGKTECGVDPQDYTPIIKNVSVKLPPQTKARYVKVFAKNFGELPSWHLGAGGAAFIFVDEIKI